MKQFVLLAIACFSLYTGFSQNKKEKMPAGKMEATHVQYTCTMHPDVVSDKPGKCPKCGMALVEKKVYTCPMHPDVVSDKPGKCPKCGMTLKEKQKGHGHQHGDSTHKM